MGHHSADEGRDCLQPPVQEERPSYGLEDGGEDRFLQPPSSKLLPSPKPQGLPELELACPPGKVPP